MHRFRLAYLGVALFGLASCATPDPGFQIQSWQGETMGTTYLVKVALPSDFKTTPTSAQLDSVLERVNASLSTYQPQSTLSRFNRCVQCYPVDSMIIRNFKASQEVHQASEGAFDPSVYPLVQAWGFGPQARSAIPDSAHIRSLLGLVGLTRFRLEGDSLCKEQAAQALEFSAVAKGYGVDVLGWFLESLGLDHYLVEIGGEVRARGDRSPGQAWTVGVEKPLDDPSGTQRALLLQLPLQNQSMASSGNYRNYYMHNGQKMAHTLQVSTGYPTPTNVLAATVVTQDCMMADAYATACMALGWDRAIAMLEKHPEIQAILIGSLPNPSQDQPYRLYATHGLRQESFYQDWVAGQRSR
ncbi:MAG: FAD:protein FMN transferase [Bacteroidota bacterium]